MTRRANESDLAQPTIKDVARMAGVSFKTVSRVLNDEQSVRRATQKRVRDAITVLGYERNEAAAELRRGRPGLAGQ